MVAMRVGSYFNRRCVHTLRAVPRRRRTNSCSSGRRTAEETNQYRWSTQARQALDDGLHVFECIIRNCRNAIEYHHNLDLSREWQVQRPFEIGGLKTIPEWIAIRKVAHAEIDKHQPADRTAGVGQTRPHRPGGNRNRKGHPRTRPCTGGLVATQGEDRDRALGGLRAAVHDLRRRAEKPVVRCVGRQRPSLLLSCFLCLRRPVALTLSGACPRKSGVSDRLGKRRSVVYFNVEESSSGETSKGIAGTIPSGMRWLRAEDLELAGLGRSPNA